MNKALIILLLSFSWIQLQAQSIVITDPDFTQSNPMDCGLYSTNGTNFYDNGGSSGPYTNNAADTLLVCPDLSQGTKVFVSFGVNIGFIFDVDASDSVYVFDGPDVFSPLLGAHNSITDPVGFSSQASWENNPSGCLTFVFHSDVSNSGDGWAANLSCGNPPQPFNPHMKAYKNGVLSDSLNPSDTGMVQVCLGDSVLYIASCIFPYSLENTGHGYSQSDTSITYKWFFSNGTVLVGDSVWFTPPNRAGYVVTLQVTDDFPSTHQLMSFVRVNPRIDFRGTRVLHDSICEGDTVFLIAGLTNNDTVGANPTVAITEVGGAYAGLTYLPDGSGINYETTIDISGFGSGQVLTSGMDIMKMVVTMEHSYLGDLEMMLSCPSGDSMIIFNAYPGQGIGPMFAGGFGGGGTFLGDADDGSNGNPGIGWTYSFSDTLADWGDMATEYAAGNTLPTTISFGQGMNPDSIYLPEMNFSAMVGCPINGVWKLTVRDNQGIDDGYIFDWAIYFNPYINPNFQSYTSSVLNVAWHDGLGNFLGGSGDTLISQIPDSNGFSYYNFQVFDDFGCEQDTTISVYQTARPTPITVDTATCLHQVTLSINNADSALWHLYEGIDSLISFFPDSTDTTVTVHSQGPGIYLFELLGYVNNCTFHDSVKVEFYPKIPSNLVVSDTVACAKSVVINPYTNASNALYNWAPGNQTSDTLIVSQSGTYYLTVTGCGTSTDSIHVQLYSMPTISGDLVVCDSLTSVKINHINLGGRWELLNSDIDSDLLNLVKTPTNVDVSSAERGYVTIGYYDSLCARTDSVTMLFERNPVMKLLDSVICQKDAPLLLRPVFSPKSAVAYRWNDNSTDSILAVYVDGVYGLNLSNACGNVADTVHVKFRDCDYMIPNVITPNGDQINDWFEIYNMGFYTEISMKIYSRWGLKVFEGTQQMARWDGYIVGEVAPSGTYFFDIIIDGMKLDGSFTLIKE